jgi:hypothetical protein
MIKAYEVIQTKTLSDAKEQNFSPNCFRSFQTLDEARQYVRNFARNAEKYVDLTVCEVTYTPVFELTCTITTREKDL